MSQEKGCQASNTSDYADYPQVEEAALFMHIFEIGLRNSSPKVLLSMMPPSAKQQINTEHIKSRLQKFRNNAQRSHFDTEKYYKEEFKDSFAEWNKEKAPIMHEKLDDVHPSSLSHVYDEQRTAAQPPEPIDTMGTARTRRASGGAMHSPRAKMLIDKRNELVDNFTKLQDMMASESKRFDATVKESINVLKQSNVSRA